MKIWIHTGGVQNGPYSKEQIAAMHLPPATPVWYEGLPQWIPACQAPELADIFGAAEPGENPGETTTVRASEPAAAAVCGVETAEALPPRPSTFLAWSIILTLCCCTPFSLAAVVTGALTTQRYNRGDYEGAQRMSGITEWLVIISITLGIVGLPVSMIAMM
ncbi:MAG: CD225/dispanin family protein [Muribaculaceae bacterium]|nr:CD225/dispanin family protein [Muribaculaceae bacterium]